MRNHRANPSWRQNMGVRFLVVNPNHQLILELAKIFRPTLRAWVIRTLIYGGITLLATPLWFVILEAILEKELGLPPHTNYPGGVLVAIGVLLYLIAWYEEKSAPREIGIEAKRDLRTIERLMSAIHTHSFDSFIENGKTAYVWYPIFHFWEHFRCQIEASSFHIFDEELARSVQSLHENWGKSLSFGDHFTTTNNPDLYRFDTKMDMFKSSDQSEAHDQFIVAIWETEKSFRSLIESIRKKFPDFDFESSNKTAWQEYVEYDS